MSRTFLSIGAGGPRVGVVLGRRDTLGAAKFIIGLFAIIFAMALFAHAGNLDQPAQWAIVIAGAFLMFKAARRPHLPPMTAEEQEASYQAAKAEFIAGRN
jgi:hypothetical protein